jgi:hypothetical protein
MRELGDMDDGSIGRWRKKMGKIMGERMRDEWDPHIIIYVYYF